MKTTFLQTLLAVAAMATVSSWAAAQGQYMPGQQMPRQQMQGHQMPGQQVAYMSDMGGYGEYGGPEMYGGGEYGCCDSGCGDYGGCGQCGGNPCCCEQQQCYSDACSGEKLTMCYLEIQNVFLRAHVNEEAVGKLSEQYEWTPRFVAGFELPSGIGARGRYFNYDEETPILDDPGEELGLKFEVIDVEGTGRIRTTHADVILSGGFRWADIEITEDDDTIQCDGPGLTVAADGRTVICRGCKSEWAGVAGARWSLLGADWEGDDNALVEETRDDNLVVKELYGGVEWVCRTGHCNFYTRAVFEMQHWSSDALDENDATIAFVGPAIHGGVTF
jgi:hypothetical protein